MNPMEFNNNLKLPKKALRDYKSTNMTDKKKAKEEFVEKYAKKSSPDPCYGIEVNINEEELHADLDALIAKLLPTEEEIEASATEESRASQYRSNHIYDMISVHDGFVAGCKYFCKQLKGE